MGALTSKPYAFISRPWELKSVESIDIFDSYLSSVRYDYRGSQILRVLPSIDTNLNSEWITDKVRFYYDAVYHQRITNPWVRSTVVISFLMQYEKKLEYFYNIPSLLPCSWVYSLEILNYNYSSLKSDIGVNFMNFLGLNEGLKSTFSSLALSSSTGSSFLSNSFFNLRSSYNFSVENLNVADCCVLIRSNTRLELPLLNLKLREMTLLNKLSVFSIGSNFNFNYFIKSLGNSSSSLYEILSGRSLFSVQMQNYNFIIFLFGSAGLVDFKNKNLFTLIEKYIKKSRIVIATLLSFTNKVISAELALSFINKKECLSNVNYHLINNDSIEFSENFLQNSTLVSNFSFPNKLITYVGSHGDHSANIADVVLSSAMNVEMNEVFLGLGLNKKFSKFVVSPSFLNIRTVASINYMLKQIFNSLNYLPIKIFKTNKIFTTINKKIILDNIVLEDKVYNDFMLLDNYDALTNSYLNDAQTRASQNLTLAYGIHNLNYKNFKNDNV